jgi:hypothetical protein
MREKTMQALIVVGPQGCGKTQLAGQMLDFFGCTKLLDSWEGEPLPDGALALTNSFQNVPVNERILSFTEAKRLMGLEDWTAAG